MAEHQDAAADEAVMRIGKRCYVGNLPWKTSWQDLKDKFRECGVVVYANVVRDTEGRSKGWGIVEFETPEEAAAAVETLNGFEMGGRRMLVREDREDRDVRQYNKDNGLPNTFPEKPRRPRGRGGRARGGGGGGGGGAGGGGDGAPAEAAERPPRTRAPREPRPPREAREENSSGLQVVVQGIPWKYEDADVTALFADVGDVEAGQVVTSNIDGRSRGYGTVRFTNNAAALRAIEMHHGTQLEGRTLTVFMDKYA